MAVVVQVEEEGPAVWSDLPGDLLAAVYTRCGSPFDRARFAAVCTSWRAVAAWHPRLAAMPLLLPSTGNGKRDLEARAYSPEDGRAVRVLHLPWFHFPKGGNRLVGSYDGGWVATTTTTSAQQHHLLVVNLFSGARALLLSDKHKESFVVRKIIFSDSPASRRCIMVAITSTPKQYDDGGGLALCRPSRCCNSSNNNNGAAGSGWTSITAACNNNQKLLDIAFCNNGGGELYAFTSGVGTQHHQLLKFDIGIDWRGAPVAKLMQRLDIERSALHVPGMDTLPTHIFELRGNLAIAVKVSPDTSNIKHDFFKVFQLAQACAQQAGGDTTMTMASMASMSSKWEEVTSLGDHALFLGPASSKAVRVTSQQRGAVKGNHIYYSHHGFYRYYNDDQQGRWLDMGSCAVRCCKSKGTRHSEKILSTGFHSYKDDTNIGCNACIWIWPPDF